MIPWLHLDKTSIPGGGGELRLMQRGAEFAIMLGHTELMNSRRGGSEEALATLSCEKIHDRKRPHVLIGGLGMGFTLRAALAALPADARVVVAELVPAVVAWARGPMAGIFGTSLTDKRVSIQEADVYKLIRMNAASYDAILLDVDNGPEGLTKGSNDLLYDLNGLASARAALRPGGILAIWSAGPDESFPPKLRKLGFAVEEFKVHAHGKKGPRHVIWLAASGGGARRPAQP